MTALRGLFATLALLLLAACSTGSSPPAPSGKPVVVFLPGFMGSELYDGTTPVWAPGHMDGPRLVVPAGPRQPSDGLTATRPMPDYDAFLKRLAEHATIVPFAYDWRQSAFDSATDLDRFMATDPTVEAADSIALVAHSAGGLVAMVYAQNRDHRYRRSSKVAKVVTIATPYFGSVQSAVDAFRDGTLSPGARTGGVDYQTLMNSLPGFYEMLPSYIAGPEGQGCCTNRATPDGLALPLALWTYDDWSRLAWKSGTYDAEAVKQELEAGAAGVHTATERWRRATPPWLFPIAGLTDLFGTGIEDTTSFAFVAEQGRIGAGEDTGCRTDVPTCSRGDRVVTQFSATIGHTDGTEGQTAGTCSLRLGKTSAGSIWHGNIVDDPSVRSSVFAALAAATNSDDWCRQE